MDNKDKSRALELAMSKIEKDFGKGMLMRLGDKSANTAMEVIPTGALALDVALGVGGIPKGRIVEVYGAESSGKTTVALHIVAESQKMGGVAAFVDAEHALDPKYAADIGVDIEDLLVSQPDSGESALEVVETLVRSNAVDVIVVDSVAALVPQAEIDGEMGDSHMGLQARLMSQALRKLTGTVAKSGTTLIFINQTRLKIGVVFGNPETTTGGNALKFYASVRLEVRRSSAIKDKDAVVGNKTYIKVVKNKVAPPFKQAELEIIYGQGISRESMLLDYGIELETIQKSGSWYSMGDIKIGQGAESAKQYLIENAAVANEIEQVVREKYGIMIDSSGRYIKPKAKVATGSVSVDDDGKKTTKEPVAKPRAKKAEKPE